MHFQWVPRESAKAIAVTSKRYPGPGAGDGQEVRVPARLALCSPTSVIPVTGPSPPHTGRMPVALREHRVRQRNPRGEPQCCLPSPAVPLPPLSLLALKAAP